MTSLLRIHLVRYRCSCGEWWPLAHLHFCRKCAALKCLACLNEEIDIIFCPFCMENANIGATATTTNVSSAMSSITGSGGEGQVIQPQKKLVCNQCHQCPMCDNLLVTRAQQDRYYLQCNACQWTSRDSGLADQDQSNSWPELTNPLEPHLNEILAMMRSLATYERVERGRLALASKRPLTGTSLLLTNDRFGLQTAYNARKKALARPNSEEVKQEAVAEVPSLPEGIFDTPVEVDKVVTLDQLIAQPLCDVDGGGQLLPQRVKLIARRSLRCVESDTMLYKGEYSPSVVKPRLQSFAMDYLPDVRISRELGEIVVGQSFPLLLTISNNSTQPVKVVMKGEAAVEDDINRVDCSSFVLEEFTIPCKDDTADIDEYLHRGESNEKLTYIRRHNVGVSVECVTKANITKESYAYFHLRYAFTPIEGQNEKWMETDIKVFLLTDQ